MKLIYVGKVGNLGKYTKQTEFTCSVDVVEFTTDATAYDIAARAGDAEAIITSPIYPITAELIERLPKLKIIHSEGVGYNCIDLDAAAKRGIPVCNCKGANAIAVAEQTLLLMLGVLRNVLCCDQAVRNGEQISMKHSYMSLGNLLELSDCTIGLIGFGDIGKETARLLKPFGARTIYYARHRAAQEVETEYAVEYRPLDELLSMCNVVSLHMPVTSETRGMVNDEFISKMTEGAFLINTSRGELIDEKALICALRSGKIAMAGLDTISGEPVQANHILLTQEKTIEDKLLFSPHIGGLTGSSMRRACDIAWDNIHRVSKGEKPRFVVNAIT